MRIYLTCFISNFITTEISMLYIGPMHIQQTDVHESIFKTIEILKGKAQ